MDNKNVMISIAIPNYNSEKYIIKLLDSIRMQTYKDFEVVISDDASKDNSLNLIRDYKKEYPEIHIRLFEQKENLGLIGNRNFVLRESKGKYITFVDCDDYLEPICLEHLMREANKNDADWVIGAFRTVDINGKTIQNQYLPDNPSKYMCGCHHGCAYKKKIFEENDIKFLDCGSIEDCYITAVFASHAKNVAFVNEILYNWVMQKQSTSAPKKEVNNFNNVEILEKFFNNIRKTYDSINNKDEKVIFEYQIIKIYCVILYHNYRYASIKDKIKAYKNLKKMMLEFNPNYRKNPLIKWNYPTPVRKYAKIIIWITMLLEKTHLMPIALIGYHIISKFYYFEL